MWAVAGPCHICTRTGLISATSAPGLGSALPHLHRDWTVFTGIKMDRREVVEQLKANAKCIRDVADQLQLQARTNEQWFPPADKRALYVHDVLFSDGAQGRQE